MASNRDNQGLEKLPPALLAPGYYFSEGSIIMKFMLYTTDTPTDRAKKLTEIAFAGLVKNDTTIGLMASAAINMASALEQYQKLDSIGHEQ